MDTYIDEITAALNSVFTARYAVLAVYSLALCEWLDCLPTEVDVIYPSRWTSIKITYFLCRYYQLVIWPLVLFAYVPNHGADLCHSLTRIVTAVLLPLQLFAPAVMIMRAYAFAGRHKPTLMLLLVLYLALIGLDVWFFCFDVPTLPDSAFAALHGTGCFPFYTTRSDSIRLTVVMGASSLMDGLSLSIIIGYCLRIRTTRGTLGRTFIRQGLEAFVLMLIIHALALGTYFSPQTHHSGLGLPWALTCSNLVACRLILDLRRKALPTETEIGRRHSELVNNDLWIIGEGAEELPGIPLVVVP
ncbi:hypothetical protein HMN09_01338700 [Mycena chlorophos]|uniref:DUF6533 domain-containing protein n=1 Tax=Mycena chlorophos TaxID=658473 RepID=A0A8H6RZB5_MYCCL|nr:hypothetical protein HMN09_01338700 [Mycena chlorophos]